MHNEPNIRLFSRDEVPQMYQAFMESFSDYAVPFEMNLDGFRKKFIGKLNLDFNCSAGAFIDGKLAAFMFSTINNYEGLKTAYNGGTGVLPTYRGRGLTPAIWDFLVPRFRARDVKKCVLEVLTSNTRAISIYKKIGFQKVKKFKCFRLLPYRYTMGYSGQNHLEFRKVERPDWSEYATFFDYSPSFIDSQAMVDQNIENEDIIEAYLDDRLAGYIIFQSPIGRISHLAVSPDFRNTGIGTSLIGKAYKLCRNKYLTVINLPEGAKSAERFLINLGFENQLDQYEMSLFLD
jgi:ribosomal protein S18 acetylase RimI-like enzyme